MLDAASTARTCAALAVSALLVLLTNEAWSMEWSFPYCNDPNAHDGPAYAVYGFPLPHTQASGSTSMALTVMPAAWLANALMLGAPAFWLARRLLARIRSRAALVAFALACGLPVAALLAIEAMFVSETHLEAVLSPHYDGGYTDLRPVGIGLVGSASCRPSSFWFGSTTGPLP